MVDRGKTVNDFLEVLTPKQLNFLLLCLQQYSKGNLHRGLLPFVSINEAAAALKFKLLHMQVVSSTLAVPGAVIEPMKGERFIRGIISKFEPHLAEIQHLEIKVKMHLKDAKLGKYMKRRFADKFFMEVPAPINGILAMVRAGPNRWNVGFAGKVLTKQVDATTTWLSEKFG